MAHADEGRGCGSQCKFSLSSRATAPVLARLELAPETPTARQMLAGGRCAMSTRPPRRSPRRRRRESPERGIVAGVDRSSVDRCRQPSLAARHRGVLVLLADPQGPASLGRPWACPHDGPRPRGRSRIRRLQGRSVANKAATGIQRASSVLGPPAPEWVNSPRAAAATPAPISAAAHILALDLS